MDHVAIMRKSWGLTDKIIAGGKTIESRWSKTRRAPWGNVRKGDVVYFKNSGELISIKAKVGGVVSFSELTPDKVSKILNKYGREDGIDKEEIPAFNKRFRDSRYCTLIFLKDPIRVRPFNIDKAGFGSMSSWISLEDVRKIRI
jgi:hypothetical protein